MEALTSVCARPSSLFTLYCVILQEAEQKQHDLRLELDDAHRIIDLLKVKVRVLTEHEVESERKQQRHRIAEPVVDALLDRFNFTSPESAVSMIDRLQAKEAELYMQLVTTQERVFQLEKKVSAPLNPHFSVMASFAHCTR
jgi:hypothetical protein